MSLTIEKEIKSQYAKIFQQKDWKIFIKTAEYYFQKAAKLKTSDIDFIENRLLLRNIQKRLFLGIGGELLVKAFYLKNGYLINKPKEKDIYTSRRIKFTELGQDKIDEYDTFSFNDLIDNLNKINKFENWSSIQTALKILKVFRNKEGHVVTPNHKFEQPTYSKIENGLQFMFREAFMKDLKLKISMTPNEKGIFKTSSLNKPL
jgi:hypothetical protein